jgi:hypothetical protein
VEPLARARAVARGARRGTGAGLVRARGREPRCRSARAHRVGATLAPGSRLAGAHPPARVARGGGRPAAAGASGDRRGLRRIRRRGRRSLRGDDRGRLLRQRPLRPPGAGGDRRARRGGGGAAGGRGRSAGREADPDAPGGRRRGCARRRCAAARGRGVGDRRPRGGGRCRGARVDRALEPPQGSRARRRRDGRALCHAVRPTDREPLLPDASRLGAGAAAQRRTGRARSWHPLPRAGRAGRRGRAPLPAHALAHARRPGREMEGQCPSPQRPARVHLADQAVQPLHGPWARRNPERRAVFHHACGES